jgi:hypothetical protein
MHQGIHYMPPGIHVFQTKDLVFHAQKLGRRVIRATLPEYNVIELGAGTVTDIPVHAPRHSSFTAYKTVIPAPIHLFAS